MNTEYMEIFTPVFFSPLSPSLPAGEFMTGRIEMSQIISLETQLCLGETVCKRRRAKITWGENNCVYSNHKRIIDNHTHLF